MPRSVEHIVGCHIAARALRASGKSIWPHKINLQAILDASKGNESPAEIVQIAKQLAQAIRTLPTKFFDMAHPEYDFSFNDSLEELEQMTEATLLLDMKNCSEDAANVLDNIMAEIYNWCDVNRVWTRG